jgi:hypothetical protein
MKNLATKNKIKKSVSKLALILLLMVTVLYSCNFRNNQRRIPEKDFVKVLTEIYVADGLLSFPSIRNHFSSKDSITNYIDIIERNGFTKERMDRTLKYYYDKNPKELENIYDQVLAKLNQTQLAIEKSIAVQKKPQVNLWTGPGFFSVPESGIQDLAYFSIPVKDTGNYVLEFTALVFPDDQSINPHVNVFFFHADTSKAGYKEFWPVLQLVKDGQRHKYTMSKRNSNLSVTHISGDFFSCDPKEGRWEKHARIENIFLGKAYIE